jgi:hypothetical protein
MGLEESVKGRCVGCELSLCWRVAEVVEVVETNWISFLLITLFIFLLFVFSLSLSLSLSLSPSPVVPVYVKTLHL